MEGGFGFGFGFGFGSILLLDFKKIIYFGLNSMDFDWGGGYTPLASNIDLPPFLICFPFPMRIHLHLAHLPWIHLF